jgi:hypothetical protein
MAHKHIWVLMAVGAKVWVVCSTCSERFLFTTEGNGTPYWGKVPEKYGNA